MINNKCPDCNGSGYIKVKEDLLVNIPAGINNGQQIKIKEKGARGVNGGTNGDLYIEINVAPHQTFTRQGNDIHISIPIDFVEAALGTTVNVPTVYENNVELKIPAGETKTIKIKFNNTYNGEKRIISLGFSDIIIDQALHQEDQEKGPRTPRYGLRLYLCRSGFNGC